MLPARHDPQDPVPWPRQDYGIKEPERFPDASWWDKEPSVMREKQLVAVLNGCTRRSPGLRPSGPTYSDACAPWPREGQPQEGMAAHEVG